jgi:hypothetical protein
MSPVESANTKASWFVPRRTIRVQKRSETALSAFAARIDCVKRQRVLAEFPSSPTMVRQMNNPLNRLAVLGLALGGVFGMAGTFVGEPSLRSSFWAIDAVGLIVATALLAVKHFRTGNDIVAGGFLVFAIGEAVILSGTAMTLEGSVPSFAAGTALWAAALLMISLPDEFATGVRLLGVIAAILFAITSGRIFWGELLLPTASPLPYFAYPFLVFTFVGWIWTILRRD